MNLFVCQYEFTSLHLASSAGHMEVVRVLLDRGANTEAKTEVRAMHSYFVCVSASVFPLLILILCLFARLDPLPFIMLQQRSM